MSDHFFPEGTDNCLHCGTLKAQTERKVCPGPKLAQAAAASLRPKPALRGHAVDDSDTISARIAELRAEREAGWNTVKGDDE